MHVQDWRHKCLGPEVEWYILETLPRTTLWSCFSCFKVAAICVRVATAGRGTGLHWKRDYRPRTMTRSSPHAMDVRITPNRSPIILGRHSVSILAQLDLVLQNDVSSRRIIVYEPEHFQSQSRAKYFSYPTSTYQSSIEPLQPLLQKCPLTTTRTSLRSELFPFLPSTYTLHLEPRPQLRSSRPISF